MFKTANKGELTLSMYQSNKFNKRKIVLLRDMEGLKKSLIHALKTRKKTLMRKKILTTAVSD